MPTATKPQLRWSESLDGRWQGRDVNDRVRGEISQNGRISLMDAAGTPRVEIDPGFDGDLGPTINVQDAQGARVFAVFSNGRVTVGRADHPLMRVDADGTIHVRPGAIVEDLPPA